MKWKKVEKDFIEENKPLIENLGIFKLAEQKTKQGWNTTIAQKVSWAVAYVNSEVEIYIRLTDTKVHRVWGEEYFTTITLFFNGVMVGRAKFLTETTHPKIITNFCKGLAEKMNLPEEVALNIESRAKIKIRKLNKGVNTSDE